MSCAIGRIVIVGGGTAGWITAGTLAAELRDADSATEILVVESPDIPTIGVGEGTWPSMRGTLQRMGIPESRLLAECDASFKQGTGFVDWSGRSPGDTYFHPFSLPVEYTRLNPARFWLEHRGGVDFASLVSPQPDVIRHGLAPKQASTPDYAFAVNYGYHFDAGRFASLLRQHACDHLGVRLVSANVVGLASLPDGDIQALELDTGERVDGGLFVDCTGHRALLIHGHFGIGYKGVGDTLFNDTAIAVQVPRERRDEAIASVTWATAQEAGWIWDIGLQSRRGVGYVHSSAHIEHETALQQLVAHLRRTTPGLDPEMLDFRTLRFEPGHRELFWYRNCVAVGLSAGFVEPLEASSIALIEQSANLLARQLPASRELMDVVARRFNEKMAHHWQRIVDFLKLHYVLSIRDDSGYWADCRRRESCPASLRDALAIWQQQTPWHDDAPLVDELFPSASYQYVLYGMGQRPAYPLRRPSAADRRELDAALHQSRARGEQLRQVLPSNRELIEDMVRRDRPRRSAEGYA